jgi:hypothetical protein
MKYKTGIEMRMHSGTVTRSTSRMGSETGAKNKGALNSSAPAGRAAYVRRRKAALLVIRPV